VDPVLASIADFERLPVPVGVCELDATITAVNAAGARLMGRSAAGLVGRRIWDFAPGAEYIWNDVIASARVADYRSEIAIAAPEGPRTIQYVVALRTFETRTVALLFGIEVRAAEEDRSHRVESLSLIAGGIAHAFNNQLVSVLAEASSVREDLSLSKTVQDSLGRIEAAAQRMALLTRQLLAYAGSGRFVAEVVAPDALIAELNDQMDRSVRTDAEITLALGAPHAALEADRGLLREVVLNLVFNAAESLPPGGGKVRVTTTLSPRAHHPAWWLLEIADEGVGMDARTVARIFDPFFTTKADRHGLGLSAVHGIVRRLGGEIAVESKPGLGTTFQVRLPTLH
jgi:signal transduction histidine kinase